MTTSTAWNAIDDHFMGDDILETAKPPSPKAAKAPLSNEDSKPPSSTAATPSTSATGLSELAKQLRLLQTRNDAQLLEIDRLERQLRILADLSNVSVGDLRSALDSACAGEAHEELQNTIARLQNQLEAASLLQTKTKSSHPNKGSSESTKHEIASLQLRIGELEEVEEQQRKEREHLYADIKEQSTSWIRLRAQYGQQQKKLNYYRQQEQYQTSLKQLVVFEQESIPSPLQQPEEVVTAMVEDQIEQRQRAIAEQQLGAAEEAHQLKEAQLKARNYVLEERLIDLDQQLSSLYTAFHITSQERDREQEGRQALESNLNSADLKVAQYVDIGQHGAKIRTSTVRTAATPAAPATMKKPSLVTPVASPAPNFARRSVLASPRHLSQPLVSPITAPKGDCVMEGTLLLQSSGLMRMSWKQEKHAALYISFTHYHLVLSNDTQSAEKTYSAPAGTSQLQLCPKQPFAFTLLVAPGDYRNTAVILYLAATNEASYFEWMSALGRVVASNNDIEQTMMYSGGRAPSESPAFRSSSNTTIPESYSSTSRVEDDQEAADLERAIQLSTREL